MKDEKNRSGEDSVEVSDEKLVALALEGDELAFGMLVRRHQERAVRTAYAVLRNYEDARDIAQESFVSVHRRLTGFRQDARFSTWLYRIVVNKCKDFLKSRREFTTRDDSVFERIGGEGGAMGIQKERLGIMVTEALDRLGERQKEVIVLRYFEGLSIEETAAVLKVAPGTVKATVFQSLRALRGVLNPQKEVS